MQLHHEGTYLSAEHDGIDSPEHSTFVLVQSLRGIVLSCCNLFLLQSQSVKLNVQTTCLHYSSHEPDTTYGVYII